MNLVQIALKSIRQRALASSLTALGVALGVMLMVCVLVVFGILRRSFTQNSIGYHLVVGPKGSDLQLVLSSVYRIGAPIENIPYKLYEEIQDDPRVAVAVPICMGDFTEEGGFPIIATNRKYFEVPYQPGRTPQDPGKSFRVRGPFVDGAKAFDAVIGSFVASKNGWDLGDQFQLVHGGADTDTSHVHDEKFTVTGVLAPTGTPNDKTVFVMLEGFYAVAGHDMPLAEALQMNHDYFGQETLEGDWEFDPEERVGLGERFRRVDAESARLDRARAEREQATGAERKAITEEMDRIKLAREVELERFYRDITAKTGELESLRSEAARIGGEESPTAEQKARLDEIDKRVARLERAVKTPHAIMHNPPVWMKEVTAVFVRMQQPEGQPGIAEALSIGYAAEMKSGLQAQAVNPVVPMQRLQTQFVGNVELVLFWMTILIVIVSGVGIFVSIYNSMADRRREIAVMRALGARRGTVFTIILLEAVLLCATGGVVGVLLGHVLVLIAAPFVAAASGLLIDPFAFETAELYVVPGLVLLASLIGIVPGLTAYRTDVAEALAE